MKEAIKLSEGNIDINLHETTMVFLDMTPKHQKHKQWKKTDKLDIIKILIFCALKVTTKKWKTTNRMKMYLLQIIYLIRDLHLEYIKKTIKIQ